MISRVIANYFGFNKQQRNGLFVLVMISFLLLVIRLAYPYFITPADIYIENLPLTERKLDSAYSAAKPYSKTQYSEVKKADLFVFDPNSVSYEQLLALGFREKTAKIFLKFRSKGFVFKDKTDLKKIYGVSDKLYAMLAPYVLIGSKKEPAKPDQQEKPVVAEKTKAKPEQKIIDLNSCDSAALVALNGIGPSYAKRILKYRSLLGGYVAVEQLKEVYGFPEELYENTKPFVTVNAVPLKKINLNSDDFKTINKHPYLSYELTKSIFDWRRKTSITSVNLKDILNDEALYKKLLPYLTF